MTDISDELILEIVDEEGKDAAITFYQRLFIVSYAAAKTEVTRILQDYGREEI